MKPGRTADQVDLILLNALQEDLPLVHNPWEIIGNRVGIPGEEVLSRVIGMVDSGIIRGVTPTLESGKRGKTISTLIAMRVPEEEMPKIAGMVNEYREVSHNFRRDHEYNLWFTLAADSRARVDEILGEILIRTGIFPQSMLNLTTERRYKVDVLFPLIHPPDGDNDGSS